MSAFKSSMMMAIFAMFFCLSSTVAAADLYTPGGPGTPVNCTTWADHCKALTVATYGEGKNSSYTGASPRCNVTNISAAQPLCGVNVACVATFLIRTDGSTAPPAAGNGTTGGNSTTGGNGTISTGGYKVASVDMTSELLAMYDAKKCSNAVRAVVSFGALVIVASITTLFSSML
ncbi:hypothetical protein BGX34_004525 [Mortierella sp. NVP85]|nr:hypothetical protein BGX34_004525 [Mortierella sp. NVP85]